MNATNICPTNARCINTIGSYNCSCNYGDNNGKYFKENATHCTEVCPPNKCFRVSEVCVRVNNDWKCICAPGFNHTGKYCDSK